MVNIKISPPYIPLTQQKFCCYPCCIQWVLLRHGLPIMSQEIIAKQMGLTISPADVRLFNEKMKIVKKLPKNKSGYGIWKDNTASFLRKNKIPLKVTYYHPSKIKNIYKFLVDRLKIGDDIVVSLNMAPLANPKTPVNYGHSMVVSGVSRRGNQTIVTLGDPAYTHRKFFDVPLEKLIAGMDVKYGKGKGFRVFTLAETNGTRNS